MEMVAGTPAYMSLGRVDLINPCSDIYSLGAILYGFYQESSPTLVIQQGDCEEGQKYTTCFLSFRINWTGNTTF